MGITCEFLFLDRAPPEPEVEDWDKNNPEHNEYVNWNHLDPRHKIWKNEGYNRIRLDDLRDIIDKYFEIEDWRSGDGKKESYERDEKKMEEIYA